MKWSPVKSCLVWIHITELTQNRTPTNRSPIRWSISIVCRLPRTLSLSSEDTSYKIRSVLIVAWGTNQLGLPFGPPRRSARDTRTSGSFYDTSHNEPKSDSLTFTDFISTNWRSLFMCVHNKIVDWLFNGHIIWRVINLVDCRLVYEILVWMIQPCNCFD